MSAISDLLNLHNTATSGQSAQTQGSNPMSDFITTLAKHAMPIATEAQNKLYDFMPGAINLATGNLDQYKKGWQQNQAYQKAHPIESAVATIAGGIAPDMEGGGEGLPPIGETPLGAEKEVPVEKPPMITKNKADPQAVAAYNLNFDVPRRIAQNQQVKPDTVINQLIDDGITGRSLDDLQAHADSITGEKGAFPTINNHILKSIADPIDYSDALTSKNTNLPAVLEGEKPGFINEINKEVNQAMKPLDYNVPGQLPSSLPAGQGYASDLFQTSQNLRAIARMYQRKAYTDMGELSHPEMERAAKAILEIKNNIDDAIDQHVTPEQYQAFKTDPVVQEQLQRVPPKIAQRFLAGADKFKDGQAIQAPYVNLSHMIEDTKDTQLSVWTKAAKAMQAQKGSDQIAQAVKENIPGAKMFKNMAGGLAKGISQPFDKSAADIFEENTKGQSAALKPKKGLGSVLKTAGILGTGVAGGVAINQALNPSNGQANNGNNQPADTIDSSQNNNSNSNNSNQNNIGSDNVQGQFDHTAGSIPQSMDEIKPDANGNYSAVDPRTVTGSDGTSLAMSDGQHQTALAALDSLVKQDPSYITNPIKKGQLAAAQDAIKTKYTDSQKLMDSYNKVTTVSQKIADAKNLLSQTSPALIDKIGVLEPLHEMVDPKYQALINDFNFIENSDPRLKGQLSNLATKTSAQTALDDAAKLLLSEHNQLLNSYGGGKQPDKTISPSAPASQLPAGLPAPVNGALPPMQGGSYQFTPPNPMFQ